MRGQFCVSLYNEIYNWTEGRWITVIAHVDISEWEEEGERKYQIEKSVRKES